MRPLTLSTAPATSRRSTMKAFSAVRRMRSSARAPGASGVSAEGGAAGGASSSTSSPPSPSSVTRSQSIDAMRAPPTWSPTR